MTIACEMRFEAAHLLPNVPLDHKCRRLHGHSYRCELQLQGDCGAHSGWVRDFSEVRAQFEPLRQMLDHHYLNDIEGLHNPTAENIAVWIWERLRPTLPELAAVVVHETCTARCIYTGPTR
jgi:6-pyruvoyltetrahydropterin/6-carboxytetrahydropterin synthase